jgi:hypothetical protein
VRLLLTEGNTGLGWAIDAVPPLKGGSALHIPSPPAIWFPRRRLVAVRRSKTPSVSRALPRAGPISPITIHAAHESVGAWSATPSACQWRSG